MAEDEFNKKNAGEANKDGQVGHSYSFGSPGLYVCGEGLSLTMGMKTFKITVKNNMFCSVHLGNLLGVYWRNEI